jgi:aspartyl-tRNA(Asn)/glutamyl-tRNA(Gln) amidotransferase subunit A
VVAGTCAGSFGSDTCGSIRIPAALSGCVGLKPTYGRVSQHRVVPLADRLDHAGPIARTVRDAALLYTVVAGFDAADARTLPVPVGDVLTGLDDGVRGLRVGRLRGWYEQLLDPGVRSALDRAAEALRDAGATVVDVTTVLEDAPLEEVFTCVAADGVPYHWARFGRGVGGYSEALAGVLAAGPPSAEDAAAAQELLATETDALMGLLRDRADLLLCATQPAPAPLIGAEVVPVDGVDVPIEFVLTRLTSVFDAARLPALSVPFGASGDGLPYGVQVIGRHLDEATVLRAGQVLERST